MRERMWYGGGEDAERCGEETEMEGGMEREMIVEERSVRWMTAREI